MIKPIYNDSEVKLEVKPINSLGQARELKYSIPTYNLLKIITICLIYKLHVYHLQHCRLILNESG